MTIKDISTVTAAALGTDWAALNTPLRLRLILQGGLPDETHVGEAMRRLVGSRYSDARLGASLGGVSVQWQGKSSLLPNV